MSIEKQKCSLCGTPVTIEQRNDLCGEAIRCRTVYHCPHCKRDLMFEERYI